MTLHIDIKTSLPNFPDEVISLWLEPFAEDCGWPPEHERWKYLLGLERGIPFWSRVQWTKEQRVLDFDILNPRSQRTISQMFSGYINGVPNIYTQELGPSGKDRFTQAKVYLRNNGIFPVPPIFLAENDGLSIMDGNHRMLAYYFLIVAKSQGLESALQPSQIVWIGRQP